MDWFKNAESFKEANGYEIDGSWYPRVTKILSIKAKPALYRYYAEAASYADAQASTQKSAEEGTLLHEILQKIMVGETPDIPPAIAPAVEAAARFLEEHRIKVDPESVERRIVHYGERYAGTIDALALVAGRFGVLDIKTSQAIYRDYGLQTAAYMDPLSREHENLAARWILRVDQAQACARCGATLRTKGGRGKVKLPYPSRGPTCQEADHEWGPTQGIVELKELPAWQGDYEAFLAAKKLWEWENEHWLRQVGYQ